MHCGMSMPVLCALKCFDNFYYRRGFKKYHAFSAPMKFVSLGSQRVHSKHGNDVVVTVQRVEGCERVLLPLIIIIIIIFCDVFVLI